MDNSDKVKPDPAEPTGVAPRGVQRLAVTKEDHLVAGLAALAILIHIAETAIPSPLPGIKPGLANVVTLLTLMHFGWRAACWVSLLRVFVGSIVLGTFLGPPFFLGLSGAVGSLLLLGLLWKWNECCSRLHIAGNIHGRRQQGKEHGPECRNRKCRNQGSVTRYVASIVGRLRIGPVGMGLMAAMAHMFCQFYMAYWLFIPHPGLFTLLPVLLSSSVIFGLSSGVIVLVVLRRLPPDFPDRLPAQIPGQGDRYPG